MTCNCVDVFPEAGKILPGGNALNFAVNCKNLGVEEVYLMGNIGRDKYGKTLKAAIDKYNINREMIYEKDGQTANHTINIDENGERYFKENSWISGVWADYRISRADAQFIRNMDAVATTFYDPAFAGLIDIKRNSDFFLCADFHDEKIKPEWEKYFDAVDLFFLSANNQPVEILREWSKRFAAVFTATFGKDGSISYKNGIEYICKAVNVDKIVDTTGCGDSYQSAFLVEYMKSKDIAKAMRKGSESAAKTLSFIGGFK